MRQVVRLASTFLCLVFCLTASAADAPDISGKLVDPSGKAVANASVQLIYCDMGRPSTGRDAGRATTDAEGKFRFPSAFSWVDPSDGGRSAPPRYCLVAMPDNAGMAFVNLEQSDASENVTLQLTEREVLPVAVVDAAGKPVAGARVWVAVATPKGVASAKGVLSIPRDAGMGGRTDDQGKIDLIVVPGAATGVAAEKEGYIAGYGYKKITLQRGAGVTGRVLDPEGKPVAGAKVTCSAGGKQEPSIQVVLTDGEGKYHVKDINIAGSSGIFGARRGGGVTISAVHPTSAALVGSSVVNLKLGETATQDITLEAKLEVAGEFVDADSNEPLPGIRLRMHSYPRAGGVWENGAATTDGKGYFSFTVKPNHAVQIMMENAGAEYLIDQDWLRAGNGNNLNFNTQNMSESKTDLKMRLKLRKLAPLAGKIVDSGGKAVANANVSVDGNLPVVTSDAQGNFAFKAAPTDRAGKVTVTAGDMGAFAPYAAGETQMSITALPLISVDCNFETPEGTPADNLNFTLMLESSPGGMNFRSVGNNRPYQTSAEGKCRVEKLIPGVKYMASWRPKDAYGQGSATFTASADGAPVRLIAPKYNNKFALIVENEDGEPIADARLQFRDYNLVSNDKINAMFNLKTGAEGTLTLKDIRGGMLDFEINALGYRQHHVVAKVKDGEYVATMTRQDAPARHTVIVTAEDSTPVANLAVRIFQRDREGKALQTDAQGQLEISGDNATLLCQSAEHGWGTVALQSYRDGREIIRLRKAGSPRKLRLVSAEGKPVAKATMALRSVASGHSSESNGGANYSNSLDLPDAVRKEMGAVQVTDDNGMVTFLLADARLSGSVQITSAEYGNQYKSFQENGNAAGTDIVIEKRAKIIGKLILPRAAGSRPNDYQIVARGSNGGGVGAGVNQDCSFAMELDAGAYKITGTNNSGQKSNYLVRSVPMVKLLPGETKTIELEVKEGIAVRGKYIPKNGKMPSPLPKLDLQLDDQGRSNPKTVSDDGSFEFFVPGPGEYQMLVEVAGQPNNYRQYPDPIKVRGEQAVENLEIKGE